MVKLKNYKDKFLFACIVGSLYIFFGLLQILVGFRFIYGWTEFLYIPTDFIGGFILLLIGTIFYYGAKEIHEGVREGVAYVYVGIFLSLGFLLLYLLLTGANMISAFALNSEEYIGWTPLDNLKPGIYLAIFPLFGFFIWRKKFTLKGITTAGT